MATWAMHWFKFEESVRKCASLQKEIALYKFQNDSKNEIKTWKKFNKEKLQVLAHFEHLQRDPKKFEVYQEKQFIHDPMPKVTNDICGRVDRFRVGFGLASEILKKTY